MGLGLDSLATGVSNDIGGPWASTPDPSPGPDACPCLPPGPETVPEATFVGIVRRK